PVFVDVGVARLRLLVSIALAELVTLLVDDEPVGEHGLVGRLAKGDDAVPKRGLKPAAMLIAAFEIEIRRPRRAALAAFEHGRVTGAGVEPHVQGVTAAGERGGRGPAGRQGNALED